MSAEDLDAELAAAAEALAELGGRGSGGDPVNAAEPIDLARLRRWLVVVEFAIDATERERVDALLELAEQIEDALVAATARERAA